MRRPAVTRAWWVLSFLTACVIWMNHHGLLKLVGRVDRGLIWWNASLLLWTSFIPFPRALMGDSEGRRKPGPVRSRERGRGVVPWREPVRR